MLKRISQWFVEPIDARGFSSRRLAEIANREHLARLEIIMDAIKNMGSDDPEIARAGKNQIEYYAKNYDRLCSNLFEHATGQKPSWLA